MNFSKRAIWFIHEWQQRFLNSMTYVYRPKGPAQCFPWFKAELFQSHTLQKLRLSYLLLLISLIILLFRIPDMDFLRTKLIYQGLDKGHLVFTLSLHWTRFDLPLKGSAHPGLVSHWNCSAKSSIVTLNLGVHFPSKGDQSVLSVATMWKQNDLYPNPVYLSFSNAT